MKTSNFKEAGLLRNAIAIAQGVPRGWIGLRFLALAPPWWLLKAARAPGGNAIYDRHFGEQLGQLDPRTVYDQLLQLAGPDPILLCWEPFNVCCHRRMVAEWFEQALGIEIPELGHVRSESLSYAELTAAAEGLKAS